MFAGFFWIINEVNSDANEKYDLYYTVAVGGWAIFISFLTCFLCWFFLPRCMRLPFGDLGLCSIMEKGSLVFLLAFLIETIKDGFIDFSQTTEKSSSVTGTFVWATANRIWIFVDVIRANLSIRSMLPKNY